MNEGRPLEIEMDTTTTNVLASALQWIQSSRIILVHVLEYKHSSFDIHVSADMTACPWKLNHGDHHISCFYHCHTHMRFPQRCSNPRHDVPRRGHGSSDVASTALPCLSFADRWDPRLWVPHVSDRMVGLFASGDPHPPDVPLIPLGPTAPLPLCA